MRLLNRPSTFQQFRTHLTDTTRLFLSMMSVARKVLIFLVIGLTRRSTQLLSVGLDCSVEFVILGMTAR